MKFIPTNRHLFVEKLSFEEEDKSYVLVPDDYGKQEIHGCFRILASAGDCNVQYEEGKIIIALNSMVEEINVTNNKFLVILENHVIGYLEGQC